MPEPTPEAWAQIRHEYEHTDRQIVDICAEYGITSPMLRYRVKRWEWRKRRSLIPRQGPPPVEVVQQESVLPTPVSTENPPHPVSSHSSETDLSPHAGRGEEAGRGNEAIVPRLQSAVARVLPAIEATVSRLASGSHNPREMEQAGRTLSSLTRALRELNALLAQHNALTDAADADEPVDLDELRAELARRLQALIAQNVEDRAQTGSGLDLEPQK